jgi:hypothetical protein
MKLFSRRPASRQFLRGNALSAVPRIRPLALVVELRHVVADRDRSIPQAASAFLHAAVSAWLSHSPCSSS